MTVIAPTEKKTCTRAPARTLPVLTHTHTHSRRMLCAIGKWINIIRFYFISYCLYSDYNWNEDKLSFLTIKLHTRRLIIDSLKIDESKKNKTEQNTNVHQLRSVSWLLFFYFNLSVSFSLSLCVPRYIQVPDAIFSHIYFKFSMEEIKYIGNCSGTNISIIPLNVYIKTVCSECSWKLTTEPNQKKLVLINKKVLQYYHNPKLKKNVYINRHKTETKTPNEYK